MVGIIYKRQDGKKKEEGLLVCSCEQTYLFIFLIYFRCSGGCLLESIRDEKEIQRMRTGGGSTPTESKYGDQVTRWGRRGDDDRKK